MYKKIEIDGKPLELLSNAATPRIYKTIFRSDLFSDFTSLDVSAIKDGNDFKALEIIKQLTYVLNIQATKPFREYYGKVTEDDYIEWLTGFEEEAFYDPDVLIQIIGVWQKSVTSSVAEKNAASPLQGS